MARIASKEAWKGLSSTERWSVVWILVFLSAYAIAVSHAVDVVGRTVKGGVVPRILATLFNVESDSAHIVSQPLLWLARVLLVATVATVVISVRATIRRQRTQPQE